MRYLCFICAVLLIAGCETTTSPVSNGNSNVNELTQFADSLYQAHLDSAHMAGGAILVVQGKDTLLNKGYGKANIEFDVPMPNDASFEIGSITKQFTAAAILRLADEGKISLDDDLTKYVEFDTKGRNIPVRMLLNHTSGIMGYTEIPEFGELTKLKMERDTLLRLVETHDFLFEPGETISYNNTGYFLLGLIIEAASDTTYQAYLKEQFFDPLGMNNTYYCSETTVHKKKASGYDLTPDGLNHKGYIDHTWPYAAGSLCSTTEDLMKWTKALHNGKVLSDELYEMLINPETLNDGTPMRYAFGLYNYIDNGHKRISHGGGIPGFISEARYYPEDDLYVVSLVNTGGPYGGGFFADQVTWELLEKEEPTSLEMENGLEQFAGEYGGNVGGETMEVMVSFTDDAMIVKPGELEPDTLTIYLGNKTWLKDGNYISLNGDQLTVDVISGIFRFKKLD